MVGFDGLWSRLVLRLLSYFWQAKYPHSSAQLLRVSPAVSTQIISRPWLLDSNLPGIWESARESLQRGFVVQRCS